ncbi:uncharacterized protein LOC134287552 [Aedes albopictus]|uniref:Reverse transcriptase domain-containing protein n=1 Tax=Aedes albopictus TaxID=7160 RepID=A0ABM1YHC7_AEDAL
MAHTSSVHFLENIERNYGAGAKRLLKDYANETRKLGNRTSRKSFLVRCRRRGVFPAHFANSFRFTFPLLEENGPFSNKVQRSITRFMKSILNIEIKHTYHKIEQLRRNLATLSDGITASGIPEDISRGFFESQAKFNEKNIRERTNRTKRKFNNILLRSREQNTEENTMSGNPKAIHNGTQTTIPPETEILLSLGPKFALPMTDLEQVPFYHLMADVEQVIKTNPNTVTQDQTRCAVANVITNYIHRMRNRNNQFEPIAKFCNKAEETTRRFLKDNPNILVLKSDKGNKTVLMEASEYRTKMLELLEDRNTYNPIPADPTSRFERQNNSIVKRLQNLDLIDKRTTRQLIKHNSVCPRIYGQPKAHKPGLPLRPVVPNTTAPSYSLSKFVGKIFQRSLVSKYNIRDSFEFCEFINNVTLPDEHVLISLDVKVLFTSLVMSSIITKWDEIKPNTNICLDLFLEIVEFCIDSSYFRFDGQHYEQVFGTAMGNPLSPYIADWVMETLLDTVVRMLQIPLPFIRKFVDDLITAIPLSQLKHVIDTFNSYDIHIQFTYELEVDNKLPYLDMLLTRHSDQKVTTSWYQKPIASGRFLQYQSFHPLGQKLNVALNFARRVNRLSTDLDEQSTRKIIDDQLKMNGYPKPLRSRIINRMNERNTDRSVQHSAQNLEHTYLSIANIPHLSNMIDRVIRREYTNVRLAMYNVRKVNNMFSKVKDPVALENQSNVVYHIPCSNCEASYVGITTNRLRTRMSGHKTHYNTLDRLLEQDHTATSHEITSLGERTALMYHSIAENHRFDLKRVKIIDRANNTQTLQFLEMCHIKNNVHAVNKRTDTEGLHAIYAGILHEIGKVNKPEDDDEENGNRTNTQTDTPC